MQSSYFKNGILPIINRFYTKQIHFVGIGGIGMCGLAMLLLAQGYCITGSDIAQNDMIRSLLKLGIKIFFGHRDSNINQEINIVVISSAIDINNPEVQQAKRLKIPVIHRVKILSELMRYKYGIAIAGTHGKTTTVSMLTNIYVEAGLDPTFVNGGIIRSQGVSARLGYGNDFIAESDESDKSFLRLCPVVAVITNIDTDHMNTYHQNFEYLQEVFIKFLDKLPMYGYAVVCIDDPVVRKILPRINRKIITYGFSKDATLCIVKYYQYREKSNFTILIKNNKELQVVLNTPGYHNALNAAASIAVAIEEGIRDTVILKSMSNFTGTNRRFEFLGNYPLNIINGRVGKVMVIDDYGHHPAELRSTIIAIRTGWSDHRLVMVFQPHRFTRTHELYDNFVRVLSTVDVLLMLDIYSAGEQPIMGINAQSLCDSILKYAKVQPIFVQNECFLLKFLMNLLRDKDLLLIQGAGTISEIVKALFIKR
ncbi:UDP-N-acetylmuramate:alanine ligase [Candidatus Blochmanniella floridana]|uniref:UDP-N-acetylmuramate--L-alanine ligase n=1 Tax=Blochmanniella floridana TaxID=203907 RepID=MURC_BLOFL|nr:RecName: Full=UDP-N-acetylmuramate--L-alanine ligase; AltName: Full=UDP-N-acetylmuramoyl-L-alanine synthetase [Candidatus Blochmannia floridanus]CAD83664.1 UDP-N-acetylmuramate:alanine ligase [Candidatus Blochmannia floridanus]